MTIPEFIGENVTYDDHGQVVIGGNGDMLLKVRGYGSIQNLFKSMSGQVDDAKAAAFQDRLGQWITDAINEKLQREREINP